LIIEENINPQNIHKTQTIQIKIKIVGRIRRRRRRRRKLKSGQKFVTLSHQTESSENHKNYK
jgi:hypothetical protein